MSRTLVVLNDPPYGTERSYNGLRLAGSLVRREGEEVRVFLIGDAASCAVRDQKVPSGYYNLERMLRSVTRRGGEVGVCGTCMDARDLTDAMLSGECRRNTMDELTDWTLWAERARSHRGPVTGKLRALARLPAGAGHRASRARSRVGAGGSAGGSARARCRLRGRHLCPGGGRARR